MTAEINAKALGGRRIDGGWMARRPARNDREPSLSIRGADEKRTWWQGVKDSRLPKRAKRGPKATAWRVKGIRALIERLGR
jgi:hypothetical protein